MKKANKLVASFHNLHLLKRVKQPQYAEPAVAWSEDIDHSHVTKFELKAPSEASSSSLLKQLCQVSVADRSRSRGNGE